MSKLSMRNNFTALNRPKIKWTTAGVPFREVFGFKFNGD